MTCNHDSRGPLRRCVCERVRVGVVRLLARDLQLEHLARLLVLDGDPNEVVAPRPKQPHEDPTAVPLSQLDRLLVHAHIRGPRCKKTSGREVRKRYGTVYIPEELKRRIEETARREERSEAEVIRSALDAYTGARCESLDSAFSSMARRTTPRATRSCSPKGSARIEP